MENVGNKSLFKRLKRKFRSQRQLQESSLEKNSDIGGETVLSSSVENLNSVSECHLKPEIEADDSTEDISTSIYGQIDVILDEKEISFEKEHPVDPMIYPGYRKLKEIIEVQKLQEQEELLMKERRDNSLSLIIEPNPLRTSTNRDLITQEYKVASRSRSSSGVRLEGRNSPLVSPRQNPRITPRRKDSPGRKESPRDLLKEIQRRSHNVSQNTSAENYLPLTPEGLEGRSPLTPEGLEGRSPLTPEGLEGQLSLPLQGNTITSQIQTHSISFLPHSTLKIIEEEKEENISDRDVEYAFRQYQNRYDRVYCVPDRSVLISFEKKSNLNEKKILEVELTTLPYNILRSSSVNSKVLCLIQSKKYEHWLLKLVTKRILSLSVTESISVELVFC